MLSKFPDNVQENYEESKYGFISLIPGCFHQVLLSNYYETIKKVNTEQFFWRKHVLR